jgi:hypothetical protein
VDLLAAYAGTTRGLDGAQALDGPRRATHANRAKPDHNDLVKGCARDRAMGKLTGNHPLYPAQLTSSRPLPQRPLGCPSAES